MANSTIKKKYPRLTIDSIIDLNGEIVLIKRKNEPYKDYWAIPGGFIELGETVEQAVIRETKEETGLDVKVKKLLGVYSDPNRDPRGHVITLAYICERIGGRLNASSDAKEIKTFTKKQIETMKLAFDHNLILNDYFKQL